MVYCLIFRSGRCWWTYINSRKLYLCDRVKIMIQIRDIFFIIVLSFFFTGVIYGIEKTFFQHHIDEEIHIEPSLPPDFLDLSLSEKVSENTSTTSSGEVIPDTLSSLSPELLKELKEKARKKKLEDAFLFSYIPQNLLSDASFYQEHAEVFLESDTMNGKIRNLSVEMYRDLIDVRGRMKQKTIKMF